MAILDLFDLKNMCNNNNLICNIRVLLDEKFKVTLMLEFETKEMAVEAKLIYG